MPKVLDWIDPGNAGGSVRIPDAPAHQLVGFVCRFCGISFETEVGRTNHVLERHPVLQPTLLLNGVPAAQQTVVRRPLIAAEVMFEDCVEILLAVDGGSESHVTSATAAAALSRSRRAFVSVRLRNSQAESSYAIRIVIPRDEDLDHIDHCFRTYLAHGDVSLADVDRFRAATAGYEACEDYASALADYVFGVLIKDQTGGTSLPFSRYREKLQGAATVLHMFSARALPLAILQCIRFNLNEFGRVEPSGVADLDRAFTYFTNKIGGLPQGWRSETSPKKTEAVALCPVDETTAALTATLSRGTTHVAFTEEHVGDLEARAATALTSDPDKIKLYVVIADAWLMRGDYAKATPYLARLEHDYNFGGWASRATEADVR